MQYMVILQEGYDALGPILHHYEMVSCSVILIYRKITSICKIYD